MNEKRFKLILDQIGKQAFPDDTNPWSPIQNRIAQEHTVVNPNQTNFHHPRHQRRLWRLAIGIVMALLGMAIISFLTPSGQALAQNLFHLFRPVSVEQLPTLSSEALASPTIAPTFAVTLASIQETEPVNTPSPVPTFVSPSGLSACADPYSYACRIAKAERAAGFDAKEFPADPRGFHFAEVAQAKPGEIWLEYDVIGGGGYLYLSQGIGSEFSPFTGDVMESAIEEVQVGDYMGEYVAGDYFYGGVLTETTWIPCCRFRLRWTDGERWYELDKQAAMPQTDYMTRDVMILMATQLVDQPAVAQGPRADYLTSLAEAAQLAEFTILAPTLLPDKFVFEYAHYDQDLFQLRLIYTPPGGQGIASVSIIETPLDKVSLAPGDNGEGVQGEVVDINGNPGLYFSNDPYSHMLTWQAGEINITLWVYSSEIWYGGSYTKDQVLEIGRSMK